MLRRTLSLAAIATLLGAPSSPLGAQAIPSPSEALGMRIGADRTLADWKQITEYFEILALTSPAVHLDTLGKTTQGRPFVVAVISTPENIANREKLRAQQARLADPRTLDAAAAARLVAEQPTVILISNNIHATEIGSSQMAMQLAWRLATVDSLQHQLEKVIVLLVPSMNPDGQQMVTDWYKEGLGGKWEGGPIPWLYHHYVGHDNNRDWYMVTQKETRLATDLLYRQWFPQIFYDVHQQGNGGMRLTVPPLVDPINPNVDPVIIRGISQIGSTMSFALEQAGKSGVGDGVTYDLWWHGGARSTPTRHNVIGLLTEAASARIATPITQKREELTGHQRGLPRYEAKVQFPNPWPGGTWTLGDIIEYERIAAEALVKLAADQREAYVRGYLQLGQRAIALGRSTAPYGLRIPKQQRDPHATERLLEVLRIGGIELKEDRAAWYVDFAQPYRAHVKDLLEVQRFPKLEQYPGGPVERPYDVAGWTLQYQMGVQVESVTVASELPSGGPLATMAPTAPRTCAVPGTRQGGARNTLWLDASDLNSYRQLWKALETGSRVTMSAQVPERSGRRPGAFYVRGASDARALAPKGCAEPLAVDRLPAGRTLTRAPRVGLYRPWTANMDEGWTRFVFEEFGIRYTNLTDSTVRAGRLRDQFDVVIVPDMSLREAREGMSPTQVPPRYAGGLGTEGLAALRGFAERGGTLVMLDHAAELAAELFPLPLTLIRSGGRGGDVVSPNRRAGREEEPTVGLYAPGSILRILVDPQHPVATGVGDSAAVYFTNSISFSVPAGSPARIIAKYPAAADEILMSGFLQGAAQLAGQAAAVEVPTGAGRMILFGFRPQYRGQAYATFRMLFNALLHGAAPAR